MRGSDIDAGLRLCRASRWNQVRRDWEQFLVLTPGGTWVAELDGDVVGTVATVRYGTRFGWIGMVLVDPAERGRGIGTLLLEQGLMLLADMPLVRLDATPAGHGIYLKRGFAEECRLCRFQTTVPDGLAAPPESIRAMTQADLPEVVALDEEIFGANRAAMLHWLWSGAPGYAWIARDDARLAGYAFGRHGHDFEHLGPVVAADATTAQELATACLRSHAGREFVVDAPLHAPAWVRALDALGFREQRLLIRMAHGRGSIPGDPSWQFASLGPEFG
ncbi:MAG: GNAT family N-acetyltransferase [Vicinamibacteria bacterium]|nr:GNAT family N-acetyltransferase [Vicinamibacteria bacterium]